MQANAVGVSRSDVSGTAFTYFSSFFYKKKKKKKSEHDPHDVQLNN